MDIKSLERVICLDGLDLTTSDYTSSLDWIRLDEIS